jgi:signal transduction histidine kinase/CheY-like chemotaxis protein/PAS domain-containing protein/HPt (histidine-containing phosphotransfer) domain-containing protein
MRSFIKKIWKVIVRLQVIPIILAFALMVISTYFFVSNIKHKDLQRNVRDVISYTEANIKAALLEPETILAGISETIKNMILRREDAEVITEYVKYINNYVQKNEANRLSGVIGFYGLFDIYGNKFIAGDAKCISLEDNELQDCPWYQAAVEAGGEIGITGVFIDVESGKGYMTFYRCIFDEGGKALGVICLDISLDRIKNLAVNTQFAENGFGVLLNENMEIIAHPDPSVLGMLLRDLSIGIMTFEEEIMQKGFVSERVAIDYRGIESIFFFEKLQNGWYMGVATPKDKYYQSTKNLALILIILGCILSGVLIIILLRMSSEKNKTDERIQIMFDTMPFGAAYHGKNYKIYECNQGAVNLFGLSDKQEYIDKFYAISPERQPDGRLSKDVINEHINTAFNEGYCCVEMMHKKLDGEPVPCEITLVRVKHDDEFVVVAYMRDLRELKQMMKEVQQREDLLNTVNSAANVLLSGNDEKSFEAALLKSFELIGNCLDADRVQIWRNEEIDGELNFVYRYEWLSEYGRNTARVPIGLHFPYSITPDWKNLFLNGGYINGPLSELPGGNRAFLSEYDIKSIVVIPIFLEGVFWGFFSIIDCRNDRSFSDDEIRILTSMGLMMSSAIDRNLHNVKLREADERMQIMFDSTPLSVNFIDNSYNHIDCNQEAVKVFEMADKKEYCERFYELSPEYQPDGKLSREKTIEVMKKAFAEGYYRFEWMHQKLNGEPIPCEITLVRVEYKNDFIVIGYARDLRELKTTIAQMNESKRSLSIMENILNGIDASIYVTIPETCEILFINNYMKKLFKVESDGIGQFCYKVFANVDKQCGFCPCYKLDKNPDSIIIWENTNPVSGQMLRCMDRYIEWYDGRIVHIHHDIDLTELIAAKEQAEQSNRFKTQFLSRMSHEVRTPMNAILGITEIQLQNDALQPDILEALSKISNSSYLLLGIINDILDLSKIENGRLDLTPIAYDTASLINDTVNLNIVKYDSKPIEFNLQVDENIPSTLFGDELRIKQILNNLLSNAYKYTDKGEIKMSVIAEYQQEEPSKVTLIFCVSDTGQGMTAEQIDKLFDEYSRFNVQANRNVEGAGLGMSITKQLIKLMDGNISVESEPDNGTIFTVRLPQEITTTDVLGAETARNIMQLHQVNRQQISKTSQITREYMPYGKVLIVDDMETNLYVARGLMSPYCLSIETAISGYKAIEKIKNGAVYDIIFMDHFMPRMDGIDTTKVIRDLGYKKPIVALTANALAGMAEMFIENGFDGFIAKPIDIRQLNSFLNKYVRDKYPPEVIKAAQKQADIIKKSVEGEAPLSHDDELKAIFARDAEKAIVRMNTIHNNSYRRANDIRQFVIDVHAMKSALASIGESALSTAALKLEQAGREGKMQLVKEKIPAFLEDLGRVVEKCKPKENNKDAELEDSEGNLAFLSEKLYTIQTACETYDDITANKAMMELGRTKWSQPVKKILEVISEFLLHSDFDEAAKIAGDYLKNNMPQSD